ncbi:hypothetical protein DV738_g5037, partial [Chaetothyriales sp. CBS 135597]
MSFDRLSALESQPTTTRRQDDAPYNDDPEFSRFTESLSTKLFELMSNISRLSNQVALLGTKRDTERVRERVHDMLEETREGFKEVGEGIKKAQAWEDLNSSQKYTNQKISREFASALSEFQVVQRKAIEKERASKAALEESQQSAQPQSGDRQQHQTQLLDEPQLAHQAEVDFQESLIIEREGEIRQIEQSVGELNELFRDVATIVREQGDQLDIIDVQVENALADTRGADTELRTTSKKRKRDDKDIPAFTARPIDPSAKPSAVAFAPIVLIPRSNLPLVWLAPAASYKTLTSPYLFEAHVLPAWQHEGCVLAARLIPNGGLYVIEKASSSSWDSADGSTSQSVATGSDGAPKHSDDQFRERNDPKISENALLQPPAGETLHAEMADIVLPTTEPSVVQQSQPEPLTVDQIVHQYLDTLYLSRTSLAFYAKGPLSRARALAKSPAGGLNIEQLIECMYTCIVPPKKADLKYKESLPTAIKSLLSAVEREESQPTKKKRTSKKVKLGKDGLYNCEHTVMEKWWRDREIGTCVGSSSNTEALEKDIRQSLSELRTRETQMQVLLILEVMALEARVLLKPEIKKETDDKADQTLVSPKPKRKPRNLQMELDALIDKLCIWHTVSTGDLQPSIGQSDGLHGMPSKSKDDLKDFYREIIKPFYASRLPRQTNLLCEKLVGTTARPERSGPSQQSHDRQKEDHRVPPENKSRPRSSTNRALERVSSDKEPRRSGSPPLLTSSSTLPSLKRERSMSALRRVPSDLASGAESRHRIQRSVSFLGRQIDLVADAKVHQAKREKMDKINMQQSELRAVIEAVKKPNRGTVSKEIMDEVEQRKKVQIMATPSRRKARQLSKNHALVEMADDEEQEPESEDMVPSSARKVPGSATSVPLEPMREVPLDASACTPSKVASHSSISANDMVAATPTRARLQPELASYLKATPVSKMNKSGRTVLFTPLNRNDVDIQDIFKDAPIIPEDAGKAMDRVMGGKGIEGNLSMGTGTSIYERLGWDYDE